MARQLAGTSFCLFAGQRGSVCTAAVSQVSLFQLFGFVGGDMPAIGQGFQNADIVAVGQQRGRLVGKGQHGILAEEFDVHHATRIVFQVEGALGAHGIGRSLAAQMVTHLVAHVDHVAAQGVLGTFDAQNRTTQRLEARGQCVTARHYSSSHQRLVLPGPGILTLIVGESLQRGHQQASVTRRPQPHIHLVKAARRRDGRQQVNDALPQASKKDRGVQRARAIGGALAVAVVQEHQIEIRAVAQLDAAQLAIANDQKRRLTVITARGHAMLAGQVLPGHGQHRFQNHFRNEGEVIAHFHQMPRTDHIRCRHVQHLGVLEDPQCFQLRLFVILGQAIERLA